MTNLDPSLTTPIAPDPGDPGNWREIDRLRRLADAEGRVFNPDDPYNWQGIAATQAAGTTATPGTAGTTPGTTTELPGVTAVAATPGSTGPTNRQMYDVMSRTLQTAGLGGLFSAGADGAPGGQLWDMITSGTINDEQTLIAWFEQTSEFAARYPAIVQARSTQGGYVPEPGEVRHFEEETARILRLAGLPASFYDDPVNDLQGLMVKGISAAELEQRVGESWTMVRNTDPAVAAAFSEFFGVEGDSMMAAFFLDPNNVQAKLDQYGRTAYTAGMGRTMGLDVSREMAERMAVLPKTAAGIAQDLQSAARLADSGLLTEGIAEVEDLTDADAFASVALGDGVATAALERRALERQANSRATVGGAVLTQRGVTGLGNS